MKLNLFWSLVFFFSCTFFILPQTIFAASLYIDPAMSAVHRGDSITMAVRLDTNEEQAECINVVDGTLHYTENIQAVDISTGESIFRLWIEPPTINTTDRTITFAGGIPNGYCGRVAGDPKLTNVLFEVIFQAPGFTVGGGGTAATVEFATESMALLNDGFGTRAALMTYPATIDLDPQPGTEMKNSWRDEVSSDSIPPDPFDIQLQLKDATSNNKHYIIFSTNDKQTGIDHYEVMEEPVGQFGSFQWGRADAPWVTIFEPQNFRYELEDQSLNSVIRVKAVDKAGNEYIATLLPDESLRTISDNQMVLFVGALSVVVLVIVVGFVLRFLIRRRRSTVLPIDNEEIK
jgi:hypothetical protein